MLAFDRSPALDRIWSRLKANNPSSSFPFVVYEFDFVLPVLVNVDDYSDRASRQAFLGNVLG